jgi:ubiquinone/menaquinone biosynthesis C-methylase UbiE
MSNNYVNSLHSIRKKEFENTFSKFKPQNTNGLLLEIGSGTGYQLELLQSIFPNAKGLDLPNSNLKDMRVREIIEYNGMDIPFEDESVDFIFSSNTLEHIPDLDAFEKEVFRVLKKDGKCIHIVPTATWRFWATTVHYIALPKTIFEYFKRQQNDNQNSGTVSEKKTKFQLLMNLFFSGLHGERGNRFTEIFYMRVKWWQSHFEANNWEIESDFPTGVFYTGHHLFSTSLSIETRAKLSKFLGSACRTFILKKK